MPAYWNAEEKREYSAAEVPAHSIARDLALLLGAASLTFYLAS